MFRPLWLGSSTTVSGAGKAAKGNGLRFLQLSNHGLALLISESRNRGLAAVESDPNK